MSEDKLKKVDRDKLPLFYRLILKIPVAEFLEGCSSGVFWAIIVPLFCFFEFFLSMFLLLYFSFPINVILTSIIPVAVFLVFTRISLERFISWWNLNIGEASKWDVEKTMEEYFVLLKKNKDEKKE